MTILNQVPLQMPWVTLDPFLFCVHHLDKYPKGDGNLGVSASLTGRNMGSDFSGKDGWSMYHGSKIPGFPSHPHRGFETITIGRQGYIDHSDSLGAKARFGKGDVQWMTAGKGVVHSEMFPLINTTDQNPTELFQIWLNLPAQDKMVEPYFTMFWEDTIQIVAIVDDVGNHSTIQVVAGSFKGHSAPKPPPNSWASRTESDIAIWSIQSEAYANLTLPPAQQGTNRVLYFFEGTELSINGQRCTVGHAVQVESTEELLIEVGDRPAEMLILQGRPIGEPVAKYGPFVMNTQLELQQAYQDYQRTQFGGWPWLGRDPVHGLEKRFAVHADGTVERRG